ncbi:phosphatase PAP2 family protein ['Camptotheca acuminata' phytoplasma]|uniref:phosphatase PAP2 family protein n=1 Tax='Camptotheca acuminata' phytoplasma TaxID=3239192 RepID=UPI00351A9D69
MNFFKKDFIKKHDYKSKPLSERTNNMNNKRKYIKKYLIQTFFLFLMTNIVYETAFNWVNFINQQGYPFILISDSSNSDKKDFWYKILNLGIDFKNLSQNKNQFFSYFIFIYLAWFVWWPFITPFFAYKYLDIKKINILFKIFYVILFITAIFFFLLPVEYLKEYQLKSSSGFTHFLIQKLYNLDGGSFNALPSLHVSIGWFCYIIFRFDKTNSIPKKIILFQFIMAILVFISTFAIRQHYIMDGICSIILVETVFYFFQKKNKNVFL